MQLHLRVLAKIFWQTGTGPSISRLQICPLQKSRCRMLKQQPPLMVPITGTPRMKWWLNLCRWPWITPSTVPTFRLPSRADISSVLRQVLDCSESSVQRPKVESALQSLPTWLRMRTALAPLLRRRALWAVTISAYSRNWQAGKRPSVKAAVVDSVSTVVSPMSPILMPLASSTRWELRCSGRNSSRPVSERTLAATLTEPSGRPSQQGRRKLGPKSNSWLPMAEASSLSVLQKSFMISPELTRGEASMPPWNWSPASTHSTLPGFSRRMVSIIWAMNSRPPQVQLSLVSLRTIWVGKAVPWMSLVPMMVTFWKPVLAQAQASSASRQVKRTVNIQYLGRKDLPVVADSL